jgi:hypothetical protein
MVKTINILTHPTPARRDAPFAVQGRRERERRGVRGRYVEAFTRLRTKLGIVFTILFNR